MEVKMESSQLLTAEEEALKRSTDCIYFLASPLTCKKGNECEFRHSEGARVNPRDCWYWMNGNCMNPKCLFRHPPLDGLFATPGTPSGRVLPTSQPVPSTQISTASASGAYNTNKQSVPCYYFQKGQCIKGDKCAFMHGPHPAGNPVVQQAANGPNPIGNHIAHQAKVSTSFTGTSQTLSWNLKECTNQQNILKPGVDKPVQVPYSLAKSSNKAQSVPNNGRPLNKAPSIYPSEYEPPRSQPVVAPVSSDSTPSRRCHLQAQPVEEHHQNGREGDEFLGESSPGFDVLVDDDIGDSDYYNDEEFKRASVHGGRNPNHSVNDFDYNHPDYEPSSRDQFNGKGEEDRHVWGHNQHRQDRHRVSSERIVDRSLMHKRRAVHRESIPHEVDGSDLRHRLLKQRRLNRSRSAVSPDYHRESRRWGDHYVADRCHERFPGRDIRDGRDKRHLLQENSISSRLRGRITLPLRSSPDRPIESRSERDRERGRQRTRLSPVRPGRSQDLTRKRLSEDIITDARSFGGRSIIKDNGDPLNFAGPKSLAELKGVKNSASSQEKPTKSTNAPLAAGYKVSEDSFEGPKSLSSILGGKKETATVNGLLSSSGDENDVRDAGVVVGSASASVAVAASVEEGDYTVTGADEFRTGTAKDDDEEEEEGLIRTEGEELISGQSLAEGTAHEAEEDGMKVDAVEDQDLENYDEDYEYEEVEGGDLKTEDNKNAYQDEDNAYQEEDDELDDEDDFAKRVGAFFS